MSKKWLTAGVATAGVSAAVWAWRDYRQWRALGPGGLPHTPAGWLTMARLRLQGTDPFLVRVGSSLPVHPALLELPRRSGDRPEVAGFPIPHRVLQEPPPPDVHDAVREVFDRFTPPLEYRTSRWEKHNQALFRGEAEVGHLHPSDGSMHVTLAPADAQRVIDLAWGELHPLAGGKLGLPATYTLLYPPRDDADLAPIAAILTAAAERVGGG